MSSSLQEESFPVSLASLNEMRDYVQKTAEGLPLSPKKVYKLKLAVDEIATNIISYSGLTEEHTILMDAQVREQSLRIRLKDQGIPFDPREKLHLAKGSLTKPAEERKIGGLGIYLAVNGVDRFDYEYTNGFNVNMFAVEYDELSPRGVTPS